MHIPQSPNTFRISEEKAGAASILLFDQSNFIRNTNKRHLFWSQRSDLYSKQQTRHIPKRDQVRWRSCKAWSPQVRGKKHKSGSLQFAGASLAIFGCFRETLATMRFLSWTMHKMCSFIVVLITMEATFFGDHEQQAIKIMHLLLCEKCLWFQ